MEIFMLITGLFIGLLLGSVITAGMLLYARRRKVFSKGYNSIEKIIDREKDNLWVDKNVINSQDSPEEHSVRDYR